MDLVQIFVTAVISAAVSFTVTAFMRCWDRHKVRWLVTGEAHTEYDGKPTGRVRANMQLWNVGDADAFDVRLIRCNGKGEDGKDFETWTTFEAGCVKAGDHVDFVMHPMEDSYETAWVQPVSTSAPVFRHRPTQARRFVLSEEIPRVDHGPSPDWPRMTDGKGRILADPARRKARR